MENPKENYFAIVSLLDDENTGDEENVENIQYLWDAMEFFLASPDQDKFLEHMLSVFLKVLREKKICFIAGEPGHELRSQLLEIICCLPANDTLKDYANDILDVVFHLVQWENEDNARLCLQIITKMYSMFQTCASEMIFEFLEFVKLVYANLPINLEKMFQERPVVTLSESFDNDLTHILPKTFTRTPIAVPNEKQCHLLPQAILSIKLFADLPNVIKLIYQLSWEEQGDDKNENVIMKSLMKNLKELVPYFTQIITLKPPKITQCREKLDQRQKEVYADFINAEVNTLMLLTHVLRYSHNLPNFDTKKLVTGVVNIFELSNHKVSHLQKELLTTVCDILLTEQREKFILHIDHLFTKDFLIISGSISRDVLRPSAYSTLAYFVFNARDHLSLDDLSKAVTVFSEALHDETLPISVHSMSCHLLLDLIDSIKKHEIERGYEKDFLRLMEVFMMKFKTLVRVHLPTLVSRSDQPPSPQSLCPNLCHLESNNLNEIRVIVEPPYDNPSGAGYSFLIFNEFEREPELHFCSHMLIYSVTDCQNLLQILALGVKNAVQQLMEADLYRNPIDTIEKLFMPDRVYDFKRYLRYSFEAMEVFNLSVPICPSSSGKLTSKSREMNDISDSIVAVFTSLHPIIFEGVISKMIKYIFHKLSVNPSLMVMVKKLLFHPSSSLVFAKHLLNFLMREMGKIEADLECSKLYLELFTIVFSLLSKPIANNQAIIKPYLNRIIKKLMLLALSSKIPENYFLLLRDLFAFVSKGDHELLFTEFLNLLPDVLIDINHLLQSVHKESFQNLFIQLCLAVPVTMSSLLPFLQMFMNPFVMAINGSLAHEALLVLDLWADTLQPLASDSLEPAWPELMQALSRCLRSNDKNIAMLAFGILGKLAGSNREQVLINLPKIEFDNGGSQFQVSLSFQLNGNNRGSILLTVDKIIETAYNILLSPESDIFYQHQCWVVIRSFLSSAINKDDAQDNYVAKFFSHDGFSQDTNPVLSSLHKFPDERTRRIMERALSAMLVALSRKKLWPIVTPFVVGLTYHYAGVLVGQQCGVYVGSDRQMEFPGMDPLVFIDAIVNMMAEDDNDLFEAGKFTLTVLLDTVSSYMRSELKACKLPFVAYLVEKVSYLCYGESWHEKRNGCSAMHYLFDYMPTKWVFPQLLSFIKTLFYVMVTLSDTVSSGVMEKTKYILEQVILKFGTPTSIDYLIDEQKITIKEVIKLLIKMMTSSNNHVREQVMHSIELLANSSQQTISQFLMPHYKLILKVVPPKGYSLWKNSADSQIAVLDAIAFCLENNIDIKANLLQMSDATAEFLDDKASRHLSLVHEVKLFCKLEETIFEKHPYYQTINSMMPLQKAALRVLALCYNVVPEGDTNHQREVFLLLHNGLVDPNKELRDATFQYTKKLMSSDIFHMQEACADYLPQVLKLTNTNFTSSPIVIQLSYLSGLFSLSSTEEQLQELSQHLKLVEQKDKPLTTLTLDACCAVITIFTQLSQNTAIMVDHMLAFALNMKLTLDYPSPFKGPVVKFLARHPLKTMELLLSNEYILNDAANQILQNLLRGEEEDFRNVLKKKASIVFPIEIEEKVQYFDPIQLHIYHNKMKVIYTLIKFDKTWISTQSALVRYLENIWFSKSFIDWQKSLNVFDFHQWRFSKLLVKCLLCYCQDSRHISVSRIKLLFHLLRCLVGPYLANFNFIRKFLDDNLAHHFTLEWKQVAFSAFVKVFQDPFYLDELKSKILQHVIIPSLAVAFKDSHLISNNIINALIDGSNALIDAAKDCSDSLRISLLQLFCLLIKQSLLFKQFESINKVKYAEHKKKLFSFVFSCLQSGSCVDPAVKYHGQLLFANFIVHYNMHKNIILKVFCGLLESHMAEAQSVVQEALNILMPIMPNCMDNIHVLTVWTKKIIIKKGHNLSQLAHLLHLLVRHQKLYRHDKDQLIQLMVNSVSRLLNTSRKKLEYRKLAIDISEVIILWESRETDEEPGRSTDTRMDDSINYESMDHGSLNNIEYMDADSTELDHVPHGKAVIDFLLSMMSQLNKEATTNDPRREYLCRCCAELLKKVLSENLWPNMTLDVPWFKAMLDINDLQNGQRTNFQNVATVLDLLTFYVVLRADKKEVPSLMRHLDPCLYICLACRNSGVIQAMNSFIMELSTLFPFNPHNFRLCRDNIDLNPFYGHIFSFIVEGLSYKNCTDDSTNGLLKVLHTVCTHQPAYIDQIMPTYMSFMKKLKNEHLKPIMNDVIPPDSDLLMSSFAPVKDRIGTLKNENQKMFIEDILVDLVERSSEVPVLNFILQMVQKWIAGRLHPQIDLVAFLLVRAVKSFQKRFPDDHNINCQLLEIIYLLRSENIMTTEEFTMKLKPALLVGLCSPKPHIRTKYFDIFNNGLPTNVFSKLFYIISTDDWQAIKGHFWIKQCVEMMLRLSCDKDMPRFRPEVQLPSLISIVNDIEVKMEKVSNYLDCRTIYLSYGEEINSWDDLYKTYCLSTDESLQENFDWEKRRENLLSGQVQFLANLQGQKMYTFLYAASQLCHFDDSLAEHLWVHIFPQFWDVLDESQQNNFSEKVTTFIRSGSICLMKDTLPCSIKTFAEGVLHCLPLVQTKPEIIKYLGSTFNLWHHACLLLEQMESISASDVIFTDMLTDIYAELKEDDLWTGINLLNAKSPDLISALTLQQQGFFSEAQVRYERAMKSYDRQLKESPSPRLRRSIKNLFTQWCKCAKELSDWESLRKLGSINDYKDPFLVLEHSWQDGNWDHARKTLNELAPLCPASLAWKVNLIKGYVSIYNPQEPTFSSIEDQAKLCSELCIKEFKKLPHLLSSVHFPLLQAAQLIAEMEDGAKVQEILKNHDFLPVKVYVSKWMERLPSRSDDFSFWSEVVAWRNFHYQDIEKMEETNITPECMSFKKLGTHSYAQMNLELSKTARKQGLHQISLKVLSLLKLDNIAHVCHKHIFMKLKQELKCSLHLALNEKDMKSRSKFLQHGLYLINCIDTKYKLFSKRLTSKMFHMQGIFLSNLGNIKEADVAFATAIDSNFDSMKVWASLGDLYERTFMQVFPNTVALKCGEAAITVWMNSCRLEDETKSRKQLAKILWLLTFDSEKRVLLEHFQITAMSLPPIHWLPWIPQLVSSLGRTDGAAFKNLLSRVGSIYPQAVFFYLNTLRENLKSVPKSPKNGQPSSPQETLALIENLLDDFRRWNPGAVSSLENFVEEIKWFRENAFEEALTQLNRALKKAYRNACSRSSNIANATVPQDLICFVKSIVTNFSKGKNVPSQSELPKARYDFLMEDSNYLEMQSKFTRDFNLIYSSTEDVKLHVLINQLCKWITKFEVKLKLLPKSFLLDERCKFLSHFNENVAQLDIPGEFLLPRINYYHVNISRFIPHVDIVYKHNAPARRLYIKGSDGKIYPFLIINDTSEDQMRAQETVLQLLRFLNSFLLKHKQTLRRSLIFKIPRVLPINKNMRFVEDNVASLSLLDIYEQFGEKHGAERNTPLFYYYKSLSTAQARTTESRWFKREKNSELLWEIFNEVQNRIVPKTVLEEWALQTYSTPIDYWTFRKEFTHQYAMVIFFEYILHMKRLDPDMIYIHKDTGRVNISYFQWDFDRNGKLNTFQQPVPFRFTPNIVEFITPAGLKGSLMASIIAIGDCLTQPHQQIHPYFNILLKEEVLRWHKNMMGGKGNFSQIEIKEEMLHMVTNAFNAMWVRMKSLQTSGNGFSNTETLLSMASFPNYICQMDPAWHPWL